MIKSIQRKYLKHKRNINLQYW